MDKNIKRKQREENQIRKQLSKDARMENRYPATTAAKMLGIHPEAIKKYLLPCEWQPSGFNNKMVPYYDINLYLNLYWNKDINNFSLSEQRAKDIKEIWETLKNYKPPKSITKTYTAEVNYLIFSGNKKNFTATPYHYYKIEVIEKGQFYTFRTPTGDVRKKIGSRGTVVKKISEDKNDNTLTQTG